MHWRASKLNITFENLLEKASKSETLIVPQTTYDTLFFYGLHKGLGKKLLYAIC